MIDDELLKSVTGKWCLDGIPYSGVTNFAGTVWHYLNGEFHREDGPAIQNAEGVIWWYMHGDRIYTWKRYHELTTLSPQEQMVVKLRYGEQLE